MDAKSAFVKRFGDLIALLRVDPANDAAQDLALTAAAAAVELEGIEVEAGVSWNVIPDDLTLKGRLLAREVETIRIMAGAEPHELLALARALSHDAVAVRSSPNIDVEMLCVAVPPPPPPPPLPRAGAPSSLPEPRRDSERRAWQDRRRPGRPHHRGLDRRQPADRRTAGERRVYLISGQRAEIEQLHARLARGVQSRDWEAVLAAALALVHLAPRVPAAERRNFGIQVRRAIPRHAVESIVDLAERDRGTRQPAVTLLRWIGLDAAEVALDRLVVAEGQPRGVFALYCDVVAGMPGAQVLLTPLVADPRASVVAYGAELLGRSASPGAVESLERLLTHDDSRVRVAATQALGMIHAGSAAAPLRQALHHPDGRTRAAAAAAIAEWRGGALVLLLIGALQSERDRETWQALATALGGLGSSESAAALLGVALTRRALFRRRGYSITQRLAAVEALGLTDSVPARAALERIAREGDAAVRVAARGLPTGRQRAG